MQQLYANVEQNLALGAHAETWEWKEAGNNEQHNGSELNV
jgi:hypothetical protein